MTKEDLQRIQDDKEALDAIFSQLKLDTHPDSEKVTAEPKEANQAINQSVAMVTLLLAMLIVGSFIGCICIYCIMKC